MNRFIRVVLYVWVALAGVLAAHAQPVTTLYSFVRGPINPHAGLTLGKDGNFYGTTAGGGRNLAGTIFRLTTNGVLTTLYSFYGYPDGSESTADLTLGPDGNFYGTTLGGGTSLTGTNASGVIFKMTTNGIPTTLVDFNGTNGGHPDAALTLGPDGYYYGTSEFGGSNSVGTVFKVTTNGTLTTLATFNTTNGANPVSCLTLAPGGTFYGTTKYGGTYGWGTAFKLTTNGIFTMLNNFNQTNGNGAWPAGRMALGPDGNLYGTTAYLGTAFEMTTNGVVTTLVDFSSLSSTNGEFPYSGLTLGPDGNFYGTTSQGGTNGSGTIFQVSTNGTLAMLAKMPGVSVLYSTNPEGVVYYTTNNFATTAPFLNGTLTQLYSFSPLVNSDNGDGADPESDLTLGPDGNFYGTTVGGGTNGAGAVFKISTNGIFTALASCAGNTGYNPYAGVTAGPGGSLYGVVTSGGTTGYGSAYKISANGLFTLLHNFSYFTDGAQPQANLIQGQDGNFYGTAPGGGTNLLQTGPSSFQAEALGTVFKLATNGTFTPLADFNGTNGANPYGGLAIGLDGNLYGTTAYGGISNNGVVFELLTNGTITALSNFTGANGANPYEGLVLGPDNNFYGTTEAGGSNNDGTVFQVTPDGALTTLVYFNGTNGANPNDGLTVGLDGNLYGTAYTGGAGFGTVFKVSTGGAFTTLYTFTQTNFGYPHGQYPVGGLAQGPDGYLYGTTALGGVNNYQGTLFKITTNGALTTLYSFFVPNGSAPFATLTLQTNSHFINFYGTTLGDGGDHPGTVFRVNLTTSYTITENTTATFLPLTNEVVWATGGELGLVSAMATNGAAQISGSGIVFTPTTNFTGTATISYAVTDNAGGTNASFITILITNIPPVANPDFYSVAENSSANVLSPLTNDLPDTSGGMLGLVRVSPTNGTASISGTNVLFTPAANFVGTATIGYTITDNIGGTNSSLITVTVVSPSTDLSLSASAAPEPVEVGSNLVYTVSVTNLGPQTITGVVVSNQIPAGVNFVSATGGATPSGGVLLVNLGAMAVGATNFQIVMQPTVAGLLTNMFQVFAAGTDPVPSNNFATVISTVTNAPAPPHMVLYNVFDLGGFGSNTFATAVNNLGQITGFAQNGSVAEVAVFWTNNLSPVFTLSQTGTTFRADCINNFGQIVGGEINHAGSGSFWTNSGSPVFFLDSQGAPRSEAAGINNSGQIVGGYSPVGSVGELPAFWTNSGSEAGALSYLGGANASGNASAINDSGEIVGESGVASTGRHATFWTNSSSLALDLGTLGGSQSSALSINAAGQIVGDAYDSGSLYHAVFWTNSASSPVALGLLDGPTNIATSINNLGQIVGAAGTASNPLGTVATIWTNHTAPVQDLNNLIPTNSGWILLAASCINDLGEIVGFGIITNQGVLQAHAFALIPINEPTNADLSLTVTAVPLPVPTDVYVTNFITISNSGPVIASGVVVSNQIPSGLVLSSVTGGTLLPSDPNTLAINVGILPVGATDLVEVVESHLAATYTNLFTVSGNQNDPALGNNSATVIIATANQSETFFTTSTLNVTDNIPSTVSAQTTNFMTVLVAKMPDGTVVYSNSFTTTFSDPSVQGAIMQAAQDLANSGASGYTGPAQTSSGQGLQVLNSVTVTNLVGTNYTTMTNLWVGPTNIFVGPNQSEPLALLSGQDDYDTLITFFETNDVVTTNTGVYTNQAVYVLTGIVTPASADLSLGAQVAPEPVVAGSNLVYTLLITNQGLSAATDVTVSNRIPASVSFVSATGGAVPSSGVLLINLGPLATNASTSAQITVQPNIVGKLTNVFMVFADQADPILTNNTATIISTVTNGPPLLVDVALSMMSAPNPVDVGDPLTYSLTVTNNSPNTATVVVTNTLPPEVAFVSTLPSQGSATINGSLVTFNVGSLPNGPPATLAIVVIPNSAGLLTNKATAYSLQTDSVPANNSATNVTTAVGVPVTNLAVTAISPITLSLQTGLFDEQVRVVNGGPLTPSWVRVLVSGLASNARLWNATGTTNGLPYVQSNAPLGVGSNVVLLLEYYVPTRVVPDNLTFTVQSGPPVGRNPAITSVASLDRVTLYGGRPQFEFSTVAGQIYAIQYSRDLKTWRTALPAMLAPTNLVQWIDAGPPMTDGNPNQQSTRYYRVVLLPAN